MRNSRMVEFSNGRMKEGGLMRAVIFCLMSFVLVTATFAQGISRSLGNRLNRSATGAQSATRDPQSAANESSNGEAGGRSIEFNAAPLDMVFTVYQDLVGKTVLKDPQTPQATITLQPKKGQELSVEDKIEAIETVLEMNGIHIEPYGEKFVRALPRKDVRKDGIPLIMDPEAKLGESTRVVSLMIPFKNIGVDEAQKALEGFKSNNGILLVFERTNSILVTDTEQIINRMREIAKAIDIASPVTETVEYIQIKYANANDVKQVIDSIVQESMKEQEKNGKAPQNSNANQQFGQRPFGGNGLLRRPGQPNQPVTPVSNASLVTTVSDADRGMIRGKVVTIADERSNKILIITNKDNMKFFKEVIAAIDIETTPDTVVKVYRLKYAEAEDVSDMINDLIGNSSSSKSSGKSNQNQNAKQGTSGSLTRNTTTTTAKKPANQRAGEAKAGELNKDNTTVLADKRINGIVVMTDKELVPTVEQIIESMDIKLSQVLIETVIIEVQLGDGLNTGIDWVQNGRFKTQGTSQITGMNGLPLYNFTDGDGNIRKFEWAEGMPETRETSDEYGTTTWTRFGDALTKVTDITKKGNFWSGTAGYASMMGGGAGNGAMAADIVSGVATNVFSSAFNYIFKSDKLNLSAIIQASKTDNRAKYLASPIVMTLDNKEATIDATESRKFFSGYETSSSYSTYMRTPKYDSKDIGIQIKVTPKINPNGTVMLNIEEEYSQVIEGGQSILVGDGAGKELIDTALSRKMSADALLENMQTVILCGLTETTKSESETGIPILKDIPIIGKWLFGSVRQNENRKELLVFMTPYVLDDAQAAQVEALRRKKTMSDPHPWEDHGWSLSELADPVSKREQMRRIKDEWKKQDEERRTKIAIEKMKVERAEKLKKMSVEERAQWLLMHKEELDDEAQDELEEKMLDKESQEELKKLAAEVRAKKLAEAEVEIKKMEEMTAAENERGKLEAEKKAEKREEGTGKREESK